mmetsp:Transcript_13575/g.16472  ORF Transcript_13575/g.16472 Transcript_13575/m.16472 type:complete len:629 (+) Transcript_13575:130-2016(+)
MQLLKQPNSLVLAIMIARASSSFISAFSHHHGLKQTISKGITSTSKQHVSPAFAAAFTTFGNNQVSSKMINSKRWMSEGTTEKTEEEIAAIQAAREARKEEKERKKAEKAAKKAAKAAAEAAANKIDEVTYLSSNEQSSYAKMGDMTLIMSRSQTNRVFANVADLENAEMYTPGSKVWLRGRLHSIRVKGGSCFLVVRQGSFHTVQALFFKDKEDPEGSKKMINYLKTLTVESIIDLEGTLVGDANVKSCSIQNIELNIERIHVVSKARAVLPFLVEDAARSEAEVEASQNTDRPFPRLGQELRLDNRWMDLRAPANNSIMRIQSAVCQLFRESLYSQGFIEIHSPKLIAGESESGAGVFTTDYFGTTACLAQSPQLYKQMAISSDLDRVFEIGPVFRAENSNTRRHLCEFTGLDLEMAITDHYMETLEVIHKCFKHIFNGLETRHAKELSIIREQYHSEPLTFTEEPCVIHWPEAQEILTDKGFDMGDGMGDLNGAMELALGDAIKEKYGTDFFMLDKYPSDIRPFYTMPDPDDDRFSNSYDMFIRGLEICSGAQRCHDPELVQKLLEKKGIEAGGGLESYINSFKDGVSPHAGAGIGLERVVFLYLGLDNVRKASMFPRDPNRCSP